MRGEAVPAGLAGAASFGEGPGLACPGDHPLWAGMSCLEVSSASLATGAVTLICAGWLPQDDVFGWRYPLV